MNNFSIPNEIERVLRLESQAILQCAERLKDNEIRTAFEKTCRLISASLDKGGKIVVTGVGKSGKIGQKIAATFSSTGSFAIFLHPTEGLHGDLGAVRPGDTLLALSHSGNTQELIQLLPALRNLGISLVGIGGNAQSQLAQKCDVWLDASVEREACPYDLAPTTSTTLALAIGDALAVTLMQLRGFDRGSFSQNHPAGSIGKKLNLKVADIMHHGKALPHLPPTASMEEVILTATDYKLGGVLIVEANHLLGLITDGDLRRALKHKERFFQLKASNVMTQSPITVADDTLAIDALRIMENRPSQISVLPVIDREKKPVGLLRLHDIVCNL